jgi:DNA polymerase-1
VSPQEKKPKEKPHSLQSVARRELGIELDKEHQTANWGGELSSAMLRYAAMDTQVLLPLVEIFESGLEGAELKDALELEHRALPAMAWMVGAGCPFDATGWKDHLKDLQQRKNDLAEKLNEIAPERPKAGAYNWNSPIQIKEAFRLIGVNLPDTKEDTLSLYDNELATTLLDYKKISTILSHHGPKLLEAVRKDGRIHAGWRQIGTETGRMSCSKPALQQLPPEVKRYVRAPEGRLLIKADYSQIELRIAAKISGDQGMLAAYQKGEDLHLRTAKSLAHAGLGKVDRKLAKAVNFGLLYGQGAKGLKDYARKEYEIDITLEEAALYKKRFFETYPGLAAWHERERLKLKRGETETRTLTGRRRVGVMRFTEWVNAPVQGTGADGLKLALALLWERHAECPGAVPVACVHDEILVECDEDEAKKVEAWLEKAMIDGMDEVLNGPGAEGPRVSVEVEVKRGRTWGYGLLWSPPASKYVEEEEVITNVCFEDAPVTIKVYIDYRDLSADSYPQIYACVECVEEYSKYVSEVDDLRPGEAARCEICGKENAAARELWEQGGGVSRL